MPSQGPLSPGGLTQFNFGGVAWSDENNAASQDGNSAQAVLTAWQWTNGLISGNYNFSIPTNATPTGIKVEADILSSNPIDLAVIVWPDGAAGASFTTTINGTFTGDYASVGGEDDLLGVGALTPEQVNANDFTGFLVGLQALDGGSGSTVAVDHLRVTIYYDEAEHTPKTAEDQYPVAFVESVSILQEGPIPKVVSEDWTIQLIDITTVGVEGDFSVDEDWPVAFAETISISSLVTVSDELIVAFDESVLQDPALIRTPVAAEHESKWIAHNGIGAYKRYKHLILYADSSGGGGDIIVQWQILKTRNRVKLDNQVLSSGSEGAKWDFSKWNEAKWASDTQNIFHIRNLGRGNAIKFRFISQSLDSRPGIRQIDLYYELFGTVKG